MTGTTLKFTLLIAMAAFLIVAGIVALDRLALDPGGRGFAGEANDACRGRGGVRVVRAQEGVIVCMDGWAVE